MIQRFLTDLNFSSIARLRIRPRMLQGITKIDMSLHFLGKKLSMPILIAPTAMQRMAHDVGERGTVRGWFSDGLLGLYFFFFIVASFIFLFYILAFLTLYFYT